MSTRAQVASLVHVPGALPDDHQDAQALALKLCDRLSALDFEGANTLILAQAAVDFGPAGICGSFSEEGAKFFRDLISAFPDLRLTVHSVVADSETAVMKLPWKVLRARTFSASTTRKSILMLTRRG
jgi:hypothetical protein